MNRDIYINSAQYLVCLLVVLFSTRTLAGEEEKVLWNLLGLRITASVPADVISESVILIVTNPITVSLELGDTVILETVEDGRLRAEITYLDDTKGEIAGLVFDSDGGTFAIKQEGEFITAKIINPASKWAYEVFSNGAESLIFAKDIYSVICFDLPVLGVEADNFDELLLTEDNSGNFATTSATVPTLSSRVASQNVIYLDFDGETVTDPLWNHGVTFTVLAADFPSDGNPSVFNQLELILINKIFLAVAEDFSPFDVNVTTDRSVYDLAPTNQRQQVIITSTNWYSGSQNPVSGMAYINTFYEVKDTPVWSFRFYNSIYSASTISHEIGHALGLLHDGINGDEYHLGEGKWGPIMGSPYLATSPGSVHQWSNGDYANSTNQEDDIEILEKGIGSLDHVVGLGSVNDRPSNLRIKQSQSEFILNNADIDTYYIDLKAGQTLDVRLESTAFTAPNKPNLDAQLTIYDSLGNTVILSNPIGSPPLMNASVIYPVPTTGRYTIEVKGVGYIDPGYRYSNYGSIGSYTLSVNSPVLSGQSTVLLPIYYMLLLDEEY